MASRKKLDTIDLKKKESANLYSVATESMFINEKLAIAEAYGRSDMINIFAEGVKAPYQSRRRRISAPLDCRVAIMVTDRERMGFLHNLQETNSSGTRTTASTLVRSKALGSVDIHRWREIADTALSELNTLSDSRGELVKEQRQLRYQLENEDDLEELGLAERRLSEINRELARLIAKGEPRRVRLSGRLSMAESEIIKWRASRLYISISDYLRFLIFDNLPNSPADAHLALDARRRFYISIIDVANNGWGDPPTIAQCSQCSNYLKDLEKMRDLIKQWESFS